MRSGSQRGSQGTWVTTADTELRLFVAVQDSGRRSAGRQFVMRRSGTGFPLSHWAEADGGKDGPQVCEFGSPSAAVELASDDRGTRPAKRD